MSILMVVHKQPDTHLDRVRIVIKLQPSVNIQMFRFMENLDMAALVVAAIMAEPMEMQVILAVVAVPDILRRN